MSICVLYPSYSFENLDFVQRDGQSDALMAAWSAVFHPAIMQSVQGTPRLESAYYPPSSSEVTLIIVPPACEEMLDSDWVTRREEAGVKFVRHHTTRDTIVAAALAAIGQEQHSFGDETVAISLAIGTCAYLLERLTRHMRYMTLLDQDKLKRLVLAGATARESGETNASEDSYREAMEHLATVKENFYTTLPHILDLRLCADTLPAELDATFSTAPYSLIVSPETFERFDDTTREKLRDGVASGQLAVTCGDDIARPMTLTPLLDLIDGFARGRATYESIIGKSPRVWARLRCGLSPMVPQLAELFGYAAAIHWLALDGWKLGESRTSAMSWSGAGDAAITAFTRYPVSASASDAAAKLPDLLQSITSSDHVPILPLAMLATHRAEWVCDLRIASRFLDLFGTFRTVDDVAERITHAVTKQRYTIDKYRSRFIEMDEANDNPISRSVAMFRDAARKTALAGRAVLTTMLGLDGSLTRRHEGTKNFNAENASFATELATAVTRNRNAEPTGTILFNEWGFSQTLFVAESSHMSVVVTVPAFGFAYKPAETKTEVVQPSLATRVVKAVFGVREKPPRNIATGVLVASESPYPTFVLRNESLTASIDAKTGRLVSVRTSGVRGNRLASELALKLSHEQCQEDQRSPHDPNFGYTITAADEVEILESTTSRGVVRVCGRMMLPSGELAARFVQTFRLASESRTIGVEATIAPEVFPDESLWENYYAIRFGIGNEFLTLRAGIHGGLWPWGDDLIESPELLDLRYESETRFESLSIFTGGIPFHRRRSPRHIDTILIPRGESERTFRWAIGVDVAVPMGPAMAFTANLPPLIVPACEPATKASWLFRCSAPNVLVINSENTERGLRLTLVETEGIDSSAQLETCRRLREAFTVDGTGTKREQLTCDADTIKIAMPPYAVRFVEMVWA
ncbi:MAG: hypothetical protein ACRC46_09850 [Thermoguttaceae bacterium]